LQYLYLYVSRNPRLQLLGVIFKIMILRRARVQDKFLAEPSLAISYKDIIESFV